MALEKRAALLLHLGQGALAQWDITAVAGNPSYPLKSLKSAHKLIDLQNRVSALAHKKIKASNNIPRNLLERRFVERNFYSLACKNGKVENVSDFCDINYHPDCGRRIVVTRNVEPGK